MEEQHQAAADSTSDGRGHGSRAGKREMAIASLLVSRTHGEAATASGISLRTLQKWLTEKSFSEAYQRAKTELVVGTTTQLRAHGIKAVETLSRIASDMEAAPAAQVSAARSILEYLYRSHEDEDISSRLDRLESERDNDEKF
jgi:hypothetical protein